MPSSQYGLETVDRVAQFTINQGAAAGTYDVCTALGDVLIWAASVYCTVVGATWTATTIQSNATTNFVIMNATEGARANFTAGKDVAITWTQVTKCLLRSGNKIQYTMSGSTGSGTSLLTLCYYSIQGGDIQ